MDETQARGNSTPWPTLPVGTREDRLATMAYLITTADHHHDTHLLAASCVVTMVQQQLLTDILLSSTFDADESMREVAEQVAAAYLAHADININMLVLLGEAAEIVLALQTGGSVPPEIALALTRAL